MLKIEHLQALKDYLKISAIASDTGLKQSLENKVRNGRELTVSESEMITAALNKRGIFLKFDKPNE
jgi:hypothetical protein